MMCIDTLKTTNMEEKMSINDRMLNERLDDWMEYFDKLKKQEEQKKEKRFIYKSLGETVEFAEKLGWVDTHGDSITTAWTANDADNLEIDALDYIKSKGYVIVNESII